MIRHSNQILHRCRDMQVTMDELRSWYEEIRRFERPLTYSGLARHARGNLCSRLLCNTPPLTPPLGNLMDTYTNNLAYNHGFIVLSKTTCPGLGGTSPVSQTFFSGPSWNNISPPSVMIPPASSCSNQFLIHFSPLILTPWT